MVDLDSDPTKLLAVVEIGKQQLITRGALTTFSSFSLEVTVLLRQGQTLSAGGLIALHVCGSLLMTFLGLGLNTRRHIVSNLSILDAPDVVWEDPALHSLYQEHKANFELSSRFRTVETLNQFKRKNFLHFLRITTCFNLFE